MLRHRAAMVHLDSHRSYTRSELLAVAPISAVRRAVAHGAIRRLRRDLYVSPDMPDALQAALAVGGSLSCTSALTLSGAWRPPRSGLHIAVPRTASRLGRPPFGATDLTVHWSADEVSGPCSSVEVALRHALMCQPRPAVIAIADSALRLGLAGLSVLESVNGTVPAKYRLNLDDLDPGAESGIESIARVALRGAGLAVASQVNLAGIGRVDLLVEGRVIVEVDGREWHRGEQERDYRRDLESLRRGFHVVRVDYAHVVDHIELVVAAVTRAASARSGLELGVTFLRKSAR